MGAVACLCETRAGEVQKGKSWFESLLHCCCSCDCFGDYFRGKCVKGDRFFWFLYCFCFVM